MTDDHDDVPGASAAARAMLARKYAFARVAAQLDDGEADVFRQADPGTIRDISLRQVDHAALYAGLALAEVDAAELEIRRVYLNESGRDSLLAVARQHLTLAQLPDADGPGDDAEGYGKSGGLPL